MTEPRDPAEAVALFREMIAITARLRAPGGCAWDRQQDLASVLGFLRSEIGELEEAHRRGDWENLREELGDLLFNVLFVADLAREQGRFDLAGALRGIRDKLVRRHPHVFEEPRELTAEQALEQWERIKAREKEARGRERGGAPDRG
jgi:uncharacterized protein YabN with tetrapyrrole methylase and pyrophosphatase domain